MTRDDECGRKCRDIDSIYLAALSTSEEETFVGAELWRLHQLERCYTTLQFARPELEDHDTNTSKTKEKQICISFPIGCAQMVYMFQSKSKG